MKTPLHYVSLRFHALTYRYYAFNLKY